MCFFLIIIRDIDLTSLLTAALENEFSIWLLAFPSIFKNYVTDDLMAPFLTSSNTSITSTEDNNELKPMERKFMDAIRYFHTDYSMWEETDGAGEWINRCIIEWELVPPNLDITQSDANNAILQCMDAYITAIKQVEKSITGK